MDSLFVTLFSIVILIDRPILSVCENQAKRFLSSARAAPLPA
jgi:hypothetical protein